MLSNQRKKKADGGQHIKVFVRVRPMNANEKAVKNYSCIECQHNKEIIVQERPFDKYSKKFSFDKVFSENSKQIDIYKTIAKPLVDEVLDGYNCTIFAYGQTGTGKTFTMEGEHNSTEMNYEENPSIGIVPRAVNQLFDELRVQQMEFTMRVSFLELYNEELFDLLSGQDDLTKLRLYEDATRKGSCIIQGLEEVLVRSKMDVYSIIKKGSAKRQTAATLMNAHSSRSHTIFTVTVHIKETTPDGNEMLKTGKLHLVDLAGSENIGRSGAVEKRAREAGNINQSLLTVGRVITSLVEKAPHIPYRESKLTRLLQDALGGRTKTSIIATISPASINLEETLSTLDYAYRAKNIQNRPEANQKLNKKELITEYSAEIDRLQRDLLATREKNGVYMANENYQEMINTIEMQSKELLDKINYLRFMEEEKEKLKETFKEVSFQLQKAVNNLAESEANLEETKDMLACTQKLLIITADERDEQNNLMNAHKRTEEKLFNHGKDLISVVDNTISDVDKLHNKIERKSKVEINNKQIGDDFSIYLKAHIDKIHTNLQMILNVQKNAMKNNVNNLGSIVQDGNANLQDILVGYKDLSTFASNSLKDFIAWLCDNEEKHSCLVLNHTNQVCVKVSTIQENSKLIKNKMNSFVTSLKLVLVSVDSLISNLMEEHTQKVAKIQEFYDVTSKEQLSSLKILGSEQNAIINTLHNLGDYHNQQINKLREQGDERIKKLDKIIQIATSAKDDELSHNNYSDIEKMQGAALQELNMKCEKMSEISNKMEIDVPQTQSQNTLLVDDLFLVNEKFSNKYFEMSAILKSDECKISDSIEDYGIKATDNFGELLKNSADFNFSFCQSISSCFKKQKESIEEFSDELMDDLSKRGLKQNIAFKKEIDEIDRVCDNIALTLDQEIVAHSDLHNDFDHCSHKVMELFNKQMERDIPTGQTPVRKVYGYSRILAETSPHEKIISRFKASKSTLPVPDSELDMSFPDSSGSSTISETDSCKEVALNQEYRQIRRSGSFKEPPTYALSKRMANLPKENLCSNSLSKSSSVPCIGDLKENQYENKNRSLRLPSTVTSKNVTKLRPRKILGPSN